MTIIKKIVLPFVVAVVSLVIIDVIALYLAATPIENHLVATRPVPSSTAQTAQPAASTTAYDSQWIFAANPDGEHTLTMTVSPSTYVPSSSVQMTMTFPKVAAAENSHPWYEPTFVFQDSPTISKPIAFPEVDLLGQKGTWYDGSYFQLLVITNPDDIAYCKNPYSKADASRISTTTINGVPFFSDRSYGVDGGMETTGIPSVYYTMYNNVCIEVVRYEHEERNITTAPSKVVMDELNRVLNSLTITTLP